MTNTVKHKELSEKKSASIEIKKQSQNSSSPTYSALQMHPHSSDIFIFVPP